MTSVQQLYGELWAGRERARQRAAAQSRSARHRLALRRLRGARAEARPAGRRHRRARRAAFDPTGARARPEGDRSRSGAASCRACTTRRDRSRARERVDVVEAGSKRCRSPTQALTGSGAETCSSTSTSIADLPNAHASYGPAVRCSRTSPARRIPSSRARRASSSRRSLSSPRACSRRQSRAGRRPPDSHLVSKPLSAANGESG